MKRLVYDIEVFPNLFLAVFYNIDTKETIIIEKSERKNNTNLLYNLVKNSHLIGYNSIDYDNIIINRIIKENLSNQEIYNWSKYVINNNEDDNYRQTVKLYKYTKLYKSIDLMRMLFSKKLRVGLKALEIMLKWHNVLECELDFNKNVSKSDIKIVEEYCINDTMFTNYLTEWCKKDIQLRFDIQNQYGIECLSLDGVNIGSSLYIDAIAKKTGQSFWDVKNIRGNVEPFYLGEIVNDFIKFDSPILNNLLEDIKQFKYIHREEYYENRIVFNNTIYDIGSGGIHSYFPKATVVESKESELYQQRDFGSYYPTQRCYLKYKHETLGDLFYDADSENLARRFEAKYAGRKVEDKTRKLSLNGVYGLFGQEYSPFLSPRLMQQTCINGQLMILMLIEWYEQNGIKVHAANTDSVDITFDKSKLDLVNKISDEWTKMTNGITIDADDLIKSVYYDINCYFMQFSNGYIKEKGRWVTHYEGDKWKPQMLNKGFKHPIIQMALKKYFFEDVPFEETLKSDNDILDYCMAQKVDKKYQVYYGLDKVQRINRYFVSNKGKYLYKKHEGKSTNLLKGFGVELLNKVESRSSLDYNINYSWYINECKKVLNEVKPIQLKLF